MKTRQAIVKGTVSSSKHSGKTSIDYVAVKHAAMLFRALNHKFRQRIIALFEDNRPLQMKNIISKLQVEESVLASHLAILQRAGIVTFSDKRARTYMLNKSTISNLSQEINSFVHHVHEIFEDVPSNKSLAAVIEKIRLLSDDYDEDEDEQPVEEQQIERAVKFVNEQYAKKGVIPSFIAPTVNSGVLLEYTKEKRRIDIRFETVRPHMVVSDAGSIIYSGIVRPF